MAAGSNALAIRTGIEKATAFLMEEIKAHSIPVKDSHAIAQVGTISAGKEPEVGTMIVKAMEQVGKERAITLEEGQSMTTELDVTEGMRFDRGYTSPYFITDSERMEAVLNDPYILLTDRKITMIQDLLPILEFITQSGKPLLIIAEDIETFSNFSECNLDQCRGRAHRRNGNAG